MQCPFCHATMNAGRTDISRSTAGAIADLVAGDLLSMPHYLYFHPHQGADSVCLDHSRQAFHCPSCEAFVIAGTSAAPPANADLKQEDEALACLSCGRTIPAGATSCAACGWSWDPDSANA